ncbi:Trp biosynthesis-associated membrane protein [Agromyces aerolatus]|uniref:Trp biosynthesis-associated membrane protein n=1 Tax=Agromyces sp. LY-1074 TaxID=3074080 RepID=UPI0028675D13|nr:MULTISPECIES: Trp biosynthesis-associated membrane protein [unclassified Agromyces]MDR5700647.1 Trp biosynthesis-associated membrane protein [Agromyces sp. LY-1074]MDR5707168.1 Trp biosynthesis-associated membrane protein [Agromyces sp. LY-1358]
MKLPSIVATIVGGGLALLAWSQTWFELELSAGAGSGEPIEVAGQIASPAVAALGLAALALGGALAIAGPGIRMVLGVLAVLLGGCVLLASGVSLGDPVAAVGPAVTDATGVAGAQPTAALVGSVTPTFWPVVAIAAGVLVAVAGGLVLATGLAWPASSRRYRDARRPRFDPADGPATAGADGAVGGNAGAAVADAEGDASDAHGAQHGASDRAIDDWDDLSRGDDPTR